MSNILIVYGMASLAVTVIPGPTTLLALTNGATKNINVISCGILGAALSDFILIGLVAIGLGSLMIASETLFLLVKWIGVGYLFWLSLQLWQAKPSALLTTSSADRAAHSANRAFMRSLLVALSNPKGLLFFSAFLPQFIMVNEPQLLQYVAFACITVAIDIAIMAGYAFGGMQAARAFTAVGLRRLNRTCAAIMAFLAGGLAIYRR
ncbi:LysE family translocator [Brenneria sp. g21c3]|uniref:LysE family translocator n=1 Tax=Brenneria sp. g21c3 TaxID=3093893 RepID=UPI002EABBE21|nr:LysE family translocator [Brenneria sp. g21c3]